MKAKDLIRQVQSYITTCGQEDPDIRFFVGEDKFGEEGQEVDCLSVYNVDRDVAVDLTYKEEDTVTLPTKDANLCKLFIEEKELTVKAVIVLEEYDDYLDLRILAMRKKEE